MYNLLSADILRRIRQRMDHFFLEAVTLELGERITGARIDKIHQPDADTIILRLWSGRENLRLLLGFATGRARMHLTEERWANPFTPLRFCQLLRSRLSRILAVEKMPLDRIIRFRCLGGDGDEYLLIAEFFGMQPNLLLATADGIIVDSLKRSGGGREAGPGMHYQLPAAPPLSRLADPLPELPPETDDPAVFEKWLLGHIAPMSPVIASDLAAAAAKGTPAGEALRRFREKWLMKDFRPVTATLAGQRILSAFPLPHLPLATVADFASPSAAADFFFSAAGQTAAGREELRRIVSGTLQRLRSRLKKIEADRLDQAGAAKNRELGELLLANLHRVRRGMREITVENYFADPASPIPVSLDPRLSAQENAERYFRLYKKVQRGSEHVERRLAETMAEIAWLDEVAHSLTETQSPEDLEEIREELAEAGLLPARIVKTRKKAPDIRASVLQGRTPGGFQLWWGKNSRSNEYVSRNLTAAGDLWFHAHRLPGCHLVLKRAGRPAVPVEDELFAAALAAGYSRGRGEGRVEVMVADGKDVRQFKGARPGQVAVESYRILTVRPKRLADGDG